ncbi:MAG: holo-ACP synthase [Candidatus Omnitrophota bacterium]|jgi:holo-[acyl-carrier protein] synthase
MRIIGTGVDITEVRRIRQAVEKWGNSFLDRVFTKEEIKNARARSSLYQHLAGRFAAKEAIFKALGDDTLNWKDIQVLNDSQGKPYCVFLNGKGRKVEVYLSISHVKTYAVANAIIAEKP